MGRWAGKEGRGRGGLRDFPAERTHGLKGESGRSGRAGEPREGQCGQWAARKAMGEGCEMRPRNEDRHVQDVH